MSKTILYGAIGRHNFGDMLFPYIIEKFIEEREIVTELVFADLLTRDMTIYGGHEVTSITSFLDSEENINVIHVGGQVGNTQLSLALGMIKPSKDDQEEIDKLQLSNIKLAYLLPKTLFRKPKIFIANSIGGFPRYERKVLSKYDYISFRDQRSCIKSKPYGFFSSKHIPDCAVLTKRFFGDRIKEQDTSLPIQILKNEIGKDYICIQLKSAVFDDAKFVYFLKSELNDLIRRTELPIVFFRAGAAPIHDSLDQYVKIFSESFPQEKIYFFRDLNIWNICNLISNAKCAIGTSLHVRIISTIYGIPRITLKTGGKHKAFIKEWDCIDNSKIQLFQLSDFIYSLLKDGYDQRKDLEHAEYLADQYCRKSSWTDLFGKNKPY